MQNKQNFASTVYKLGNIDGYRLYLSDHNGEQLSFSLFP